MKYAITKPTFIDTTNTDQIIRLAYQTVKSNSWLAVTGEVGMGKTALFNRFNNFLRGKPDKYIVVDAGKCWETSDEGISIPFLMKRMIQTIRPGDHVPGNLNEKYFRLKDCLIWARSIKRKVILLLDEAQALKMAGLRDLKKIHEIADGEDDHLFSIVMFLKPETRISSVLSSPEIGYRVQEVPMKPLRDDEMIRVAQEGFGISFEKGKNQSSTQQLFIRSCGGQTPLAIRNMIRSLALIYPDFDGVIRSNHVQNVLTEGYTAIMRRLKIANREIRAGLRANHGIEVDAATVQAAIRGDEKVKPEIRDSVLSEVARKIKEKTKKYNNTVFTD